MMRLRVVLAALPIAVGLASGCSTSPPSRFYTLAATATPTSQQSSLVIAVGPVTVPSVVDRPEFVVSTGPNEVRLDDFNRWASPLQDNLTRAIAEDLVAITGCPRVVRFPQTLATEPDYRVAIEVPYVRIDAGQVDGARRGVDGAAGEGRQDAHRPHVGTRNGLGARLRRARRRPQPRRGPVEPGHRRRDAGFATRAVGSGRRLAQSIGRVGGAPRPAFDRPRRVDHRSGRNRVAGCGLTRLPGRA